MHHDSLVLMEGMLTRLTRSDLRVLDVGALDVNGTFRSFIESRGWQYVGLDVVSGLNVDIIAEDPYQYPFDDGSFDLVISGSTAYSVLDLPRWTRELARVTKTGGQVSIVTPSLAKPGMSWLGAPDYWRMTTDAMLALLKYTGLLDDVEINILNLDVCGRGIRNDVPGSDEALLKSQNAVIHMPAATEVKRKAPVRRKAAQ